MYMVIWDGTVSKDSANTGWENGSIHRYCHNQHHQFSFNYGLYFLFWDRMMDWKRLWWQFWCCENKIITNETFTDILLRRLLRLIYDFQFGNEKIAARICWKLDIKYSAAADDRKTKCPSKRLVRIAKAYKRIGRTDQDKNLAKIFCGMYSTRIKATGWWTVETGHRTLHFKEVISREEAAGFCPHHFNMHWMMKDVTWMMMIGLPSFARKIPALTRKIFMRNFMSGEYKKPETDLPCAKER